MYSLITPYPHRSSVLYSEDFCIHPQFISFLLPFAFSIQLCTVYAQVFCILRSSVLPGPSKAKVICLQRTFVTFKHPHLLCGTALFDPPPYFLLVPKSGVGHEVVVESLQVPGIVAPAILPAPGQTADLLSTCQSWAHMSFFASWRHLTPELERGQ